MIKINYLSLLILLFSILICGCSEKFEDPVQGNLTKDGIYVADYYVAPWGDDTNPGTFDQPWGTWQKAFSTAMPGDTVYFRGGIWKPRTKAFGNNITAIAPYEIAEDLGNDGTKENPICYFNYPGEEPVMDCSEVPIEGFNTGLYMSHVNYVHLKGLTYKNIYQPPKGNVAVGIGAFACTNITFENMTVHDVGGRAFAFFGAWGVDSELGGPKVQTDSNVIKWINCDAYNCFDALSKVPGNAADGYKVQDYGGYFLMEGCRAWNCSDDGFDMGGMQIGEIKNCWSFSNGGRGSGYDGNGFKFGGISDTTDIPMRIVHNCIAANNSRNGFFDLEYAGYYRNNSRVFNNTSYNNMYGFYESSPHSNPDKPWLLSIYRNNISYKNETIAFLGVYGAYQESNNTWDPVEGNGAPYNLPSDSISLSDEDFISLDHKQLFLPRNPDGSLPDIDFLKLRENSDLIDAGKDVGLNFLGKAPDIGAFEIK